MKNKRNGDKKFSTISRILLNFWGKKQKSQNEKPFWFYARQTHVMVWQKIGVEMKNKHKQMKIIVLSLDFMNSHYINIKVNNIRPQTIW